MKRIEKESRIEKTYSFQSAYYIDYRAVKKNMNNSVDNDNGFQTYTVSGTIDVGKDFIIVAFSDTNINSQFNSVYDKSSIRNCYLKEDKITSKIYEYNTNHGQYTVYINEKGEIYSISNYNHRETIIFLK